jgi:hypothetical protein
MGDAPYIASIDVDDEMAACRLATMVEILVEHDLDLVLDNVVVVKDGRQRLLDDRHGHGGPWTPRLLSPIEFVEANVPVGRVPRYGLRQPLVSRQAWAELGLGFQECFGHAEDFYFYLDTLLRGARVGIIPAPLYTYYQRIHPAADRAARWEAAQQASDLFQARHPDLPADVRAALAARQRVLRRKELTATARRVVPRSWERRVRRRLSGS